MATVNSLCKNIYILISRFISFQPDNIILVWGDPMPSLGSRLKELREKKNIKQKDLAERFNLTKTAISLYENDKRSPDQALLKELAKFFDVSVDYLLGVSDIQNYPSEASATAFAKENMDLIREGKSFEDVSREIIERFSNPGMQKYFSADYLESLAMGKETPSYQKLETLSRYAGVDIEFFYRTNSPEDLIIARENYSRKQTDNLAESLARLNIPPDVADFLSDPENIAYIRFAMRVKAQGINPEDIEGFNLRFRK